MGASGFVGSTVTRQLVARGDEVRVLLRESSPTRGIDDLDVERHYGDIFDTAAVTAAMADREVVFYCVVDTRAWLRDPAPLVRTNVDGLRGVLDIAVRAQLTRFVFTSTIGTIALSEDGSAVTEEQPHNWAHRGGAYIASRRAAEDMVLEYHRAQGLPAVALCVGHTYGPRDWQPTPHGSLVAMAALGKLPAYFRDISMMAVGIEDAARAHLLAAEHGRVGQRYIITESHMRTEDIYRIAAETTGVRPPRFGIPVPALVTLGYLSSAAAAVLRRDFPLNRTAVGLLRACSPLDHGKATRELRWHPSPTADAIREAARFYRQRHEQRRRADPETTTTS
ncbi:NAD-dependent epimerase/dehydratase family protein [Nocardia sp. NEAU-351]|uniref:NAD-dependent epimerase/dehydratase family protein n=2 Tax=Nocardia bovistercoris TaxID=2785916 RepID=A0A931N4X5_9NOCA|nr:NAD-dependent epimerase/dehydratase family protein [Nocardia bovistercoris]